MKVGILDDDISAINILMSYLYRFMAEKKVNFAVKSYTDTQSFFNDFGESFDILFLDIEMPGEKNGIEVAREIRKSNENVVIVFVTNVAKYAINGYEVNAVDYILKPVTYADFIMKFKRALKFVSDDKNKSISIGTESGINIIKIKNILYVEVLKNYLYYHTRSGVYKTRGTLKACEESLEKFSFARINNCYLVNMKHITKIEGDSVIVGGESLKISRNKKADFMKTYTNYLGKI